MDLLRVFQNQMSHAPSGSISSLASAQNSPTCTREQCSNVKYWFRSSFVEAKKCRKGETLVVLDEDEDDDGDGGDGDDGDLANQGQGKSKIGANKMTWYVEDLNGRPATKQRIDMIRSTARALWF
jgi:hypothetical protein